MEIRVGRWDCNQCGHHGNLGPDTHCAQCGASRPKNVVFYLPDDAEVVTEEDKIRDAFADPDWVCSYCSSNNKTTSKFCTTCGNPRSKNEAALERREYSNDEIPRGQQSQYQDETEELLEKSPLAKSLFGRLAKIGIPTGLLVGLFGFLASFSTQIDVTIDSMPWERVIQVEEYKEVEEENWQVPAGGRELGAFRAVHHYNQVSRGFETRTRSYQEQVGTRQVACGQIDRGNGYFETKYCDEPIYETRNETYQEEVFDKVPVYRTKFRYAIFRWKEATPLNAQGNAPPAKWPEDTRFEQLDQFRETKRTGEYFFNIKDHKGEIHKEEMPLRTWERYGIGGLLKAEKSTIFGYYKRLKMTKE